MFLYWKRPVSVTRPMYSASAIAGVSVDVEHREDVPQHLRGRGGLGDDQVRLAEAGVVVVVVDVDRERRGLEQGRIAEPLLVGRVDRDDRPAREVAGGAADDAVRAP